MTKKSNLEKIYRKYFGDDTAAPVKHPVIHGPAYEYLYGFRGKPKGSVLLPGVGCENGCKFCITTHQFNKKYYPILSGGQEMYNACVTIEKEIGSTGFAVMDENFLKHPGRARDLLELMTANKKPFVFDIFSSAEVINEVGVDFLVRLGIHMVWVGVESKYNSHKKMKNINIKSLIGELQASGIAVNASAILFLDHHNYLIYYYM